MEWLLSELTGKRPLLPPDLPMTAEASRGGQLSEGCWQPRLALCSLRNEEGEAVPIPAQR